MLRKIRTGP